MGLFLRRFSLGIASCCLTACATAPSLPLKVAGVVWQPHNGAADPVGTWDRLGARQLLVQWTVVDEVSFIPGGDKPPAPLMPDWSRIAHAPWATEVILGLAGRFDEQAARKDVSALAARSVYLAKLPSPLQVVGWYFPVEIDPTWSRGNELRQWLAPLPRPLWVSVYDNANWGPHELAEKLAVWLPQDVGVFFQDGVGVHARDAVVARAYMEALQARLGSKRVKLIAEMFRPKAGGGFRPATVQEVMPQLAQYQDYDVFLFDGPSYLSDELVNALHAAGIGAQH